MKLLASLHETPHDLFFQPGLLPLSALALSHSVTSRRGGPSSGYFSLIPITALQTTRQVVTKEILLNERMLTLALENTIFIVESLEKEKQQQKPGRFYK